MSSRHFSLRVFEGNSRRPFSSETLKQNTTSSLRCEVRLMLSSCVCFGCFDVVVPFNFWFSCPFLAMPVVETISLIRHSQTQKLRGEYRYWQNWRWVDGLQQRAHGKQRDWGRSGRTNHKHQEVLVCSVSKFRISEFSDFCFLPIVNGGSASPFPTDLQSARPEKQFGEAMGRWTEPTRLGTDAFDASLRALCRKAMEGSEWEQLGPYLVGSNMFAPQG